MHSSPKNNIQKCTLKIDDEAVPKTVKQIKFVHEQIFMYYLKAMIQENIS